MHGDNLLRKRRRYKFANFVILLDAHVCCTTPLLIFLSNVKFFSLFKNPRGYDSATFT